MYFIHGKKRFPRYFVKYFLEEMFDADPLLA